MGFLDEIKREKLTTINSSIHFDEIIGDNILKSFGNRYTKIYKIEDINYLLSDSSAKEMILTKYMSMFNSFDKDVGISIILSCEKNLDEFYVKKEDDNFNNLRDAINETIDENIYKNGKCNVIKKYLVLDIKEKKDTDAKVRFNNLDDVVKDTFYDIGGAGLIEQDANNIIKLLYKFYNPDCALTYRENASMFNIDNIKRLNLQIKDIIKPKTLSINKKNIKFNDTYERFLYLKRTNKTINANSLNKIINDTKKAINYEYDTVICLKIRQIDRDVAIKMANKELGNVDGDIFNIQTRFASRKISSDLVPRKYIKRREEAIYVSDSLQKRDENLFNVSMYALVKGNDTEELNNNTYKFTKKAKTYGLTFVTGTSLQEYIFNSMLPYGVNQTPYSMILDTESLCGFNIFNAVDIIEKDGDYYGKNKLTNNIIKYNIMNGDNYSELILGMSGKGKSFIAKLQLLTRILRIEKREAVILDPMNEWRDAVYSLGGKVIDVTAAGDININLFDIDSAYGDNPLAEKEEFILSVCALMLRHELTAGQRTTISIAVNNIYKKWASDKVPENVPTLEEFASELKKIIFENKQFKGNASDTDIKINSIVENDFINGTFVDKEDKELLKAVMYYSETSTCKIFRGKSKVSINNPIICFNLKDLGSDLKPLAMEVVCDLIWLRICKTKEKRIPTDVIIDEFHLMFKDKSTSSWMAKYWKMLRKHLGCPLGITQNPSDVLSSEDGRNVINNTGFSILLSLLENDRQLVKDVWKISNEELKYITDKRRGEGIMIFGASKNIKQQTVVPFENEFKKSNYIYRIINTTYDEE